MTCKQNLGFLQWSFSEFTNHFLARPMPSSRWSTQNQSNNIFESFLSLILICFVRALIFSINVAGPLHINYGLQFCGFCGILFVRMRVYMSMCILWTFSLVLFLLSFVCFCPILDFFILHNFILLLFLDAYFYFNDREKEEVWMSRQERCGCIWEELG